MGQLIVINCEQHVKQQPITQLIPLSHYQHHALGLECYNKYFM